MFQNSGLQTRDTDGDENSEGVSEPDAGAGAMAPVSEASVAVFSTILGQYS